MNTDAVLDKLKITSYSDPQFSKKLAEYTVLINPATFSHGFSINYSEEQGVDTSASENKFKNMPPQTLSFELMIDGTGSAGSTATAKDVDEEIKKLKEVVYEYEGDIHESPYVGIVWGSSIEFHGRCSKLDVSYTLFKPSGKALRAKVSVQFASSKDPETATQQEGKSSPDLSHLITVQIGDTLPNLCEKIYHDSNCYLQVARINNLVDFRNLKPGTELTFPPLKR